MNTITTETDAVDIDRTHGLPFCSQQAVLYSESYAKQYAADHNLPTTGLDERMVDWLAAGRLEWLLRDARCRLSGQFSIGDIGLLMNCSQDNLFFPDQVRCLESDLCDDLGIEASEWEQSEIAPLLKRLFALTMTERLALADALEQAWHGAVKGNLPPEEVFGRLGIGLGE